MTAKVSIGNLTIRVHFASGYRHPSWVEYSADKDEITIHGLANHKPVTFKANVGDNLISALEELFRNMRIQGVSRK